MNEVLVRATTARGAFFLAECCRGCLLVAPRSSILNSAACACLLYQISEALIQILIII